MLKLVAQQTQHQLFTRQATSLALRSTHTASQKIPKDLLREVQASRPMPMREDFLGTNKLSTEELEKLDIGLGKHFAPETFGDKVAYRVVKMLRLLPDTYFGRDHYMRAVMLETIAAVPGMVGGMLRHMKSLRNLSEDNGWIMHLLHEAENERMHLMTWMKTLQPSLWNRLLILGAQGVFFNSYFWLYVFSPKTAHRAVGYLEEEAVVSYTHFLDDIDKGIIANGPAPPIAIEYYNLQPSASIRDVVLAIRADEALHRDANHHLSDRIASHRENIVADIQAEQLKQQQSRPVSPAH
ncbi:alternative oxidase-domain-containing protein [Phascolomyces articulosus]|uniref:Alternative oxidase n=1 Tax=Phascolomyces articulosus TaxID=60185 RepID=A0AAD5PB10_9FUNG|nr:alternative oxidase-domain-containing protein [Phascolomyces articulosus]